MVAVPVLVTLTVKALVVGPVRVKVNRPGLVVAPGIVSAALASVAAMVTTGKAGAVERTN